MAELTGIEGRTALVTAAGDDVGRAVALALADAGAHVAVNVTDAAVGDHLTDEVRGRGGEAVVVVGDTSDPEAARALAEEAASQLGPIDLLVHTPVILPHSLVVDSPVAEWRAVLETNCSSFLYVAQPLLAPMLERGFGRLIAITVAVDDRSLPRHAASAAARAALVELVRVTAVECGGSGVTANLVSKAITETTKAELLAPEQLRQLLAIPRPASLDEIAAAVLYLVSDQGAYVTGQTMHVDGGYTL